MGRIEWRGTGGGFVRERPCAGRRAVDGDLMDIWIVAGGLGRGGSSRGSPSVGACFPSHRLAQESVVRSKLRGCGPLRALAAWMFLVLCPPAQGLVIDVVAVGNPGNVGELSGKGAGGFGQDAVVGAVAQAFYMGSHEVTNAEYVEFLNARAASDPRGLYSSPMTADPRGGIVRTGSEGAYRYVSKPNMADKPVNFVGYLDAVRFTNWLHHGQGNGDTESGAYTVTGSGAQPRNADARWFLPSEDEWYKAAYYDPTRNSNKGGYYDYPTRSDAIPQPAVADAAGMIANSGPNVANYASQANWGGQRGHLTTVGSAGPAATSYYGTNDQGGNVWEWNETPFGTTGRGVRGGSWDDVASSMAARMRLSYDANDDTGTRFLGFRVATRTPPAPTIPGDLNGSGQLDAGDIDLLAERIRAGSQLTRYDLNNDQRVDVRDHRFWVEQLARTYPGDTNLDGQFNSADIIQAFQFGGYEDRVPLNTNWSGGDWNGDGDFNSADFVIAFQSGGYEQGFKPPALAVPEPTGLAFGWLFAGLVLARRKWRQVASPTRRRG